MPFEHVRGVLAAALAAASPRPSPRAVRRLLVLGHGAIGDTIFFLPILEALRRTYPDASLVWLANPYPTTRELIPATGLVDDVWLWETEARDRVGRAAINQRAIETRFDLAVLTLGAPAQFFLETLARIPLVAGHLRPWQGLKRFLTIGEPARRAVVNRPAEVIAGENSLTRNLRLLSVLGAAVGSPVPRPSLPIPAAARRRAEELLRDARGPLVAVHLGPTDNQYAKMWAPESFSQLARRLGAAWGCSFVIVGSAEETGAAARAEAGAWALDLTGKTTLLETFAVLERSALLLCNDTGLAKAAAALGISTATLWGPSDPAEFRSPWDVERHLDVRTGIACSPCSWMGMPARPYNYLNCRHHDCLARLDVPAVAAAILGRWPRLEKR